MVRFRRRLGSLSAVLALWALSLLGSGCTIQNCELVETALRDRECKLRELTGEVERLRTQNAALEREIGVTRQSAYSRTPPPTPEVASQTYALTSIELGMQTGPYTADRDTTPVGLQIVLIPKDPDKSPIKAPGTLDVYVAEVTREGLKRPLSSWRVPPEQLRKTWQNGILATGYFVKLPWKAYPTLDKLRILVRFTLTDGRPFEAEKTVTVPVVEPQKQHLLPSDIPDAPPPADLVPGGGDGTLPLPRKDEPPLAPKEPDGPVIPQPPKPGTPEQAAHWQPTKKSAPVELMLPVPRSAETRTANR